MKAREAKESGHELVCALMLDKMMIKKHVQWDGTIVMTIWAPSAMMTQTRLDHLLV